MFLTRAHLDRRTFLRGVGATVALPLLDAMIPARALRAATAANRSARLAFVYVPHGAVMEEWSRADGSLGRILAPLNPLRRHVTVVHGLENSHAYGPVHAITPGTWLAGASPRRAGTTDDRDPWDGMTADQIAAAHLAEDVRLPSLSVAGEEPRIIAAGAWEGEYDASYGATISFRRTREPVRMAYSPREAFDRLFTPDACGSAEPARAGRTSLLDRVADGAASLRTRLGPADRATLDGYLETVRSLERRVDTCEDADCAGVTSQADIERRFTDRVALLFDIIALAFRADVTRVASMMMAAETSAMTYAHAGAPESFHLLSHHQNDPAAIERLVRIQACHTRMFAAFVQTLAETPEGDETLLDRSQILFGSNMSDSHAHDHFPLPLAVVGGRGPYQGGGHQRFPDRTPMSTLLVDMLRQAGVPVRSFTDGPDVIARQAEWSR